MNLLQEEITVIPGEAVVKQMSQVASQSLDALRDAAKTTFHLLWDDPSSRQDKLNRMGGKATIAFAQHYDTILFLFRSYARANESGSPIEDVLAACADPFTFVLGNPTHPLSESILSSMNPEDFTPPVPYTNHEDGTITLD